VQFDWTSLITGDELQSRLRYGTLGNALAVLKCALFDEPIVLRQNRPPSARVIEL
jgi:hypothetical protein